MNPDKTVEVSWHENNRFKRITWNEPDSEHLYRDVTFDANENITQLVINNLYAPKSILRDGELRMKYAERYDSSFEIIDGLLIQTDKDNVRFNLCKIEPKGIIIFIINNFHINHEGRQIKNTTAKSI